MLQAGPLRVRTLGTKDASAPAVILCHGYGAPGDDLVGLARAMDVGPGVRWFFPEAPLEVDVGYGEGRAWWPVDMMRLQMELARGGRQWDPSATPDGMPEARDQLVACVSSLIDEHGVDPARTIIGGFSQGAMITTEVALHHEQAFAGLAILSGSHICRDRWATALAAVGKEQHVFQSHGRQDPILPFAIAEALHQTLVEAGATATFVPFDGGHEIRPRVLDGLAGFCRARLHGR